MKLFSFSVWSALLVIFPLFVNAQGASEPVGGEAINTVYYVDSLHSGCDKTSDNRYYKGLALSFEKGARLFVHYSAYGKNFKDLALVFMDDEGNVKATYKSEDVFGTKLGKIDLDSVFAENGKTNIVFTTIGSAEEISFDATISYASPRALEYKPQAEFCWKLGYLLKHSDIGYRFIKSGKGGGFGMNNYATTAPLMAENPNASSVVSGIGSIEYNTFIGRGTAAQAKPYWDQLTQSLKQCMGDLFQYSESKGEKGLPKLTCTMKAEVAGQKLNNLSYVNTKNTKEIKYEVTLWLEETTVQGVTMQDIHIRVKNLFCQF